MFYFLNNLYIRIAFSGFFAMFFFKVIGQPVVDSPNLEITWNKTSTIIFAANITAVDRGSKDLLVQKVKGVNNILQLKAAKVNFKETNLTVITADGRLHHFPVRYADKPNDFTLLADESDHGKSSAVQFKSEMTDADLQWYSERVIASDVNNSLKHSSGFEIRFSLNGIYIQDNIMFYHLQIQNKSNVPYHPEMLRFYIKDKQKAKRTATQELTEKPLYQYGNAQVIKGQSTVDLVFAIPKFTIPDAKRLNIELLEKRGGRHLNMLIKNKTIVKAKLISALTSSPK